MNVRRPSHPGTQRAASEEAALPTELPGRSRLAPVPGKDADGRRATLVAMTVASGITSLPTAAIVLAIPVIHRELQASIGELQWTVTAFLLAYSALLIAAGRLGDI